MTLPDKKPLPTPHIVIVDSRTNEILEGRMNADETHPAIIRALRNPHAEIRQQAIFPENFQLGNILSQAERAEAPPLQHAHEILIERQTNAYEWCRTQHFNPRYQALLAEEKALQDSAMRILPTYAFEAVIRSVLLASALEINLTTDARWEQIEHNLKYDWQDVSNRLSLTGIDKDKVDALREGTGRFRMFEEQADGTLQLVEAPQALGVTLIFTPPLSHGPAYNTAREILYGVSSLHPLFSS